MRNIKKVVKNYTMYPNRPAYIVECLDNENKTYEAIVPKAEIDLQLWLKIAQKNGGINSEKDFNTLWFMIEEYASEKYGIASDDAAMDAAGADL
jgi:hypothetical protein